MPDDVADLARSLRISLGLLVRRLRALPTDDRLSMPERSALSRLDREGPATAAALAQSEQISPQSMGATLAGLAARGLVLRRPDPDDGRKAILSVSRAGMKVLADRRSARSQQLAAALTAELTAAERATLAAAVPLLDRLAQRL
jgi:DNA-binding MarR family transcriptional regulator